jgi:hypothetical protein
MASLRTTSLSSLLLIKLRVRMPRVRILTSRRTWQTRKEARV